MRNVRFLVLGSALGAAAGEIVVPAANTRVVSVLLGTSHALVTREATVDVFPAGATVRLAGLSPLIQAASCMVTTAEDVDVDVGYISFERDWADPRAEELRRASQAALGARHAARKAERERLGASLETFRVFARSTAERAESAEAVLAALALLDEQSARVAAELAALDAQDRADSETREALKKRPQATAAITAEVLGGAGVLRWQYVVGGVSWEPVYRVSTSADIVVEYSASLQQETGEVWSDTQLRLSTALVSPRGAPRPPRREVVGLGLSHAAGGHATAESPGPRVEVELPGRATLRSTPTPRQIKLASLRLPAERERVLVVPSTSGDAAFHGVTVRLPEDALPWLPSSKAVVMRGGAMVATTSVPRAEPGEEVELMLGEASGVRATVSPRQQLQDDVASQTTRRPVVVRNLGAAAVNVTVEHALPESRDARVKVHADVEPEMWRVIEAGEEADMSFAYTVEWPGASGEAPR